MHIIRPIRSDDFSALQQIAIESGHGFTSLPQCDEQLGAKIQAVENTVNNLNPVNHDGSYLFVLEDTDSKEILGTTGIEASVGMTSPLYHYRLSNIKQCSKNLGVNKLVSTLNVCNDYHGATEICTLFLREAYRKGLAGRLLSKIRFLFMAQHPQRFSSTVIAEMRGVSDQHGKSPFWQWLQEHFFDIEFNDAVHLVGVGEKHFISELMPKHPIYVSLLSQAAQAVIGQAHDNTVPALRLLQQEGFAHKGYIDLFDAGPTVEAQLNEIRSVNDSITATVNIADVSSNDNIMLCNTKVCDFRATVSNQVSYDDKSLVLTISPEIAENLLLANNDLVRFLTL
ncbi:arginine N-succinyltransferase [Flavobacterium sp. W21_SRS_FM6]|uniref:arginine N-succinyltransferase n=1 Tax=Flavobacterium sp. W21_SRS_FM6 TaxID=3240268 RepID=UPI003F9217A0